MPDYVTLMFCWHAAAHEGIVARAFPGEYAAQSSGDMFAGGKLCGINYGHPQGNTVTCRLLGH